MATTRGQVNTGDYLNDNLLAEDQPPKYGVENYYAQHAPRNRQPANPFVAAPPPPPPPAQPESVPAPPLRQASAPRQHTAGARLVMAIDFGTTHTGFASAPTHSGHADLKKIEVQQRWTDTMNNQQKVRSIIAYLLNEIQWGSDIRDGVPANVNTKLELDEQPTRVDELELTLHVLKGTGDLSFENIRSSGSTPAFTSKSPEEIVTDYLTKICESVLRVIDVNKLNSTKTAVDIVVTVPVDWSYAATNATFQAVRNAGFNKSTFPTLKDTIMISEPEAASYFTARDLQESGTEFLEANDCFILVDAGGGTVDVVSYQVKKVHPHLELKKATAPTSGKHGSSFIDLNFKRWLRDEVLGPEIYAEIDPINARQARMNPHAIESGAMRALMRQFEVHKTRFSSSSPAEIKLDLPAPLDNLSVEGRVNEGELTIHRNEMQNFINPCINGVIELIENQITQVGFEKARRVKNVFLVGGFGASPYLQEKLRNSLKMRRNMKLRRPDADKSWTSIVQGAVIYGIEKARHPDATYMSAMSKTYGIVAYRQFDWLIKKGDLVWSNKPRTLKSKVFWLSAKSCVNRKHDLPIYSYSRRHEDDDAPQFWHDGQHEVERAGFVRCDFSRFLDHELRPHPSYPMASNLDIGPLKYHISITATRMEVEVLLNKTLVGRCEIRVEIDQARRYSTSSWDEGDG